MKKFIPLIALVAGFFTVSANALSVGTVDMQTVLQKSTKTAEIKADLTKQFSGRNKKLESQAKALQADLLQYEKNKAVMSKGKLDQLKQKLQTEEVSLQQAKQLFQKDVTSKQMVLSKNMIESIKISIAAIAKKDKLDLVFPNAVVLYGQKTTDITSQLLKSLK